MKEEVILTILAQESLKSELQLRRYGEKNFRDLFVISGKWLGVFLEIFLNSRVPVGISVDRGLISDKCRGFFAKWRGILARDLFFNSKYHGGPGPRRMDRAARLRSTVDQGDANKRARWCFASAWRMGARTSRTRRCQRGAHRSTGGNEEAARLRQRMAAA
jgi:hypothetical protein